MKLPPYGKGLYDLIQQNLKPSNSVNLFIGTKAWDKGRAFSVSYPNRTLILPAWHDPYLYYWPVKDCDILIVDTGYANDDYIESLVISLYQHQAAIVRFIDPDMNLIVYHKEM